METLLIDDDKAFSQVLARSLASRGMSIALAHSADEALAISPTYSRVILDLNLGQDNGLVLLPQLKACNSDCTIVVLTGYASIATAVESIKLGASHYLEKPSSVDDILGAFEQQQGNPDEDIASKPLSVKDLEWEYLQRKLLVNKGNISATARDLGIHRRTLQRIVARGRFV